MPNAKMAQMFYKLIQTIISRYYENKDLLLFRFWNKKRSNNNKNAMEYLYFISKHPIIVLEYKPQPNTRCSN